MKGVFQPVQLRSYRRYGGDIAVRQKKPERKRTGGFVATISEMAFWGPMWCSDDHQTGRLAQKEAASMTRIPAAKPFRGKTILKPTLNWSRPV
jgi:hypothetical protein